MSESEVDWDEIFRRLSEGIRKFLVMLDSLPPRLYLPRWENRIRDADPVWRAILKYRRRRRNG